MSEISISTNHESDSPMIQWLFAPLVLSIFLGVFVAGMFFIAEHKVGISKDEDFVEDIEVQEQWAEGGNKLRQLAFLSCAAIGSLSLLFGRQGRFRLNLPIVLIIGYVLWAGLSVTWSIDTASSVRRYIVIILCGIGCVGFGRFMQVRDVVLSALVVSLIYLTLGVMLEILHGSFRPHVGGYRFAGTIHPNIQAASLAMGCIAAYTMSKIQPKLKLVFYGVFGLLFLFLVLTKCRSATGAVPVALGVIWLGSQPTRHIVTWSLAGFWLLSTIVLLCLVSGFNPITEYQEILLLGRKEETGNSLTGRLPLWADLATYISQRPWQGFGFGAFWTPKHIYEIATSQEWVISEAHSSYVEATLHMGIIGAALLAATMIATLFYSAIMYRKTMRHPEYLFLTGGAFFCIVRGLTESGLTGPSSITAFMFMAIVAHSWNGMRNLIDNPDTADDDLRSPLSSNSQT